MSRRDTAPSSSANHRRGVLRDHVPYRGDDFSHGRKTGRQIDEVARDSDDIESFGKVLEENKTSPLHPKGEQKRSASKKKSDLDDTQATSDEDEDDEAQSMELSQRTITQSNFSSQGRKPPSRIESVADRQRSRSRDFDAIPGPANKSLQAGRPSPHPSTSRSFSAPSRPPPDDDIPAFGDDGGYFQDDFVNGTANMSIASQINSDQADPKEMEKENHHFFGEKTTVGGAEDAENFEDAMAAMEGRSPRNSPLEDRSRQPEEGQEPQPEMEQGEEEIEVEHAPSEKKEKGKGKGKGKASPPRKQAPKATKPKVSRKRVQDQASDSDQDDSGLRRSKRMRYSPLEWWRCEKVVYGRKESGRHVVPIIKEIIRYPKEESAPLSKKGKARAQPHKRQVEKVTIVQDDPEAGWDDETDSHGVVLDFLTQQEIKRRITFTQRMINPKPDANKEFTYQKIFGDGDFIAAGELIIPPDSAKPQKSTKDNTYVFYVIEGAIKLEVYDTDYILCTGSMFLVPRGNSYYIQNIAKRDARLFFAQARKIPLEEMEAETNSQRGESAGASGS